MYFCLFAMIEAVFLSVRIYLSIGILFVSDFQPPEGDEDVHVTSHRRTHLKRKIVYVNP